LRPWPLVALFVVWANVDPLFVIGLCVVALVWVGEMIDMLTARRRRSDSLSQPSTAIFSRVAWLVVLAVSCLLNPAHARVFGAATEWIGASPITDGAGVGRAPTSPFQAEYFWTTGRTPAGLAYFPLLVLGLVSFAANLRNVHWKRALPWIALALLSSWKVR